MSGPSAPGAVAQRVGRYRLVRRLGLGGMAEIFLAVDETTGRRVALKKLLPQVASDPDFLERFFHEIRIQIALKHPNVVELLDCDPAPSHPWIAMEYVDGGELAGLRSSIGRMPWEVVFHVASEALVGLGFAHRQGIVHRDVKPQNIMWTKDGVVKIADFGISHAAHLTRLTVTGTVVGTPAHMSPEQARGEELDARTDLFSMGTVIYELLTGLNPFTTDTIAATLRRVAELEAEPPSLVEPTIPPSADAILRKLHAKDRRHRYASAEDACAAIHALLERERAADAPGRFVDLVTDPPGYMAARSTRLAVECAAEAERLLADRTAAPERALWAAWKSAAAAPGDPAAQTLLKTAAARAGQREKPLDNPRIRELEEALRKEPDSLPLLLQLAKLYRLEHDFVSMMRLHRKLQAVAPPDPYTQGQIAALVAPGEARPRVPRAAPPREPTARIALAPVLGWGAVAVIVVALAIAAARLVPRLPESGAGSGSRGPRPTAPVVVPVSRAPGAAGTQEALERGSRAEREHGPAAALQVYLDALKATTSPEQREPLLVAAAEAALRAGDREAAVRMSDALLSMEGSAKTRGLLLKGELLEGAKDEAGAAKIWNALQHGSDPDAARHATLRLAMAADRAQDSVRALALYEEVLARAPASADANAARLGAAALYRAQGRRADARRLYEEVKRASPPGSDFDRSADLGLRSLEER